MPTNPKVTMANSHVLELGAVVVKLKPCNQHHKTPRSTQTKVKMFSYSGASMQEK